MNGFLSVVAMFAFSGALMNLGALQAPSVPQTPSTQTPSTQDPTSRRQAEASNSQQAVRGFEGRIAKSGNKLVLRESSTKTAYELDDQDKARQYQGKDVTVAATFDSSTNTLHVVDITAMDTK